MRLSAGRWRRFRHQLVADRFGERHAPSQSKTPRGLREVIPLLLDRYPGVSVDLVTEGRLVDIVADGFDAKIRLSEAVLQDMIAVRLTREARFVAVASPGYLANRAPPGSPDDLSAHACIRHRLASGKLYRWEFERRGQAMSVDVSGALTLDNVGLMAEAAAYGSGIAYVPLAFAEPLLAEGRLRSVLDDWLPDIAGLCLHYPGHRQPPPALRALIDVIKGRSVPP